MPTLPCPSNAAQVVPGRGVWTFLCLPFVRGTLPTRATPHFTAFRYQRRLDGFGYLLHPAIRLGAMDGCIFYRGARLRFDDDIAAVFRQAGTAR